MKEEEAMRGEAEEGREEEKGEVEGRTERRKRE